MKSIPEFINIFKEYRRNIEALHRKGKIEHKKLESAKMKLFFSFIEEITGLKPDEYSYDAFIVKGSKPDAVTGNVIVEFEDDLNLASEIREAEHQLRKYVSELYSKDPRKYWAIASDGIKFLLYRSSIKNGEIVLERVDEIDILKDDPRRFYWFIYEYFFEERFRVELKPEDFVLRFGYGSRIFRETIELLKSLWNRISKTAFAETIFNEWSKYYTYVTGKEYRDVELFLRHTYLATLAKILAYIYLEEGVGAKLGDIKTLEKVLTGEYFMNLGLEIFEKDYFDWVLADAIKDDFLWGLHDILLKELLSFDYSNLNTDIFKEIYQNIIEHDERAALGEYYTPDFIAELMLRELLAGNPEAKILDPSCGSGTFLFISIKLKKELLQDKLSNHELLDHILNSVVGIDINPVAVVIARANYLIAIRDLLPARGILRIPVYLANAITIPEREKDSIFINELGRSAEVLRIEGASKEEYFFLPGYDLASKLGIRNIDTFISYTEKIIKLIKDRKESELIEIIINKYINKLEGKLTNIEKKILAYILLYNAKLLNKYSSENRNTFWLFILRNQYKVFFFRENFDIIIGNPPWVSRTDVESERFREWYDKILKSYEISLKSEFLGAPADTVIPFIIHSINYYLKPGGYLYFVVPATVLRGHQYEVLRRESELFKIYKIINLEKIKIHDQLRNRTDTIFNVPSILILIRKIQEERTVGIEGIVYEGIITYKSKNAPYLVFRQAIENGSVKVLKGTYIKGPRGILVFIPQKESSDELINRLITLSKTKRSRYLRKVMAGISAYPRNFVLAIIPKPKYGIDPDHIYVKTHPRSIKRKGEGEEKGKWTQILEGRISSKYLYILVTGDNVFPFGVWGLNIAVLPAIADYDKNRFFVLNAEKAREELRDWYVKGIKEYYKKEKNKEPNEREILDFINWLLKERINYQNKFVRQRPRAYTLIYNTSGDALNMGTAVINRLQLLDKTNSFILNILNIKNNIQLIKGIVIDYTNYIIDFENENEAHYLCAMLQSTPIRQAVHRLQPRGKKGARHITDRPLQLPIPDFVTDKRALSMKKLGISENDIEYLAELQLELAQLSIKIHSIVDKLLEKYVYKQYNIPFVNNTDKILTPQSVAAIRKRIREDISDYQTRIDEMAIEIIDLALKMNSSSRTLLDYIK